ncbi:Cysteine--tRNA ligase, cytoplasmic [Clonorchis sinensis]|uniref:cysteine--tRNA ligase n=1 Tax=Clonorchis sinensis TaxID=79923 RepID=A0A8T1MMF5_CLOSI|nr:Cysteine--tRNA ligase, cytoplasmic [Clonorchis sinensis]
MEKRTQPKWQVPTPSERVSLPDLRLFNSLTSRKEDFVPESGIKVRWYTCGPTVYDVSHMGHARTYIAFDALRRVLKDYFLFDVVYVLNITDVDDKIIKRARQNHLFDEYVKMDNDLVGVYGDISEAIRSLKEKSTCDPDPDKREYFRKEVDRLIGLLSSQSPSGGDAVAYLINHARDAIADVLDRKHGASVTDHRIFEALARNFEDEYHKDMQALNVLKPDVLVRVTEFIGQIIEFIHRIIENGFGYVAASGSVYFDTNKFACDPMHFYGKLVPTAYGDTEQLAAGEGELAASGEKRSPNDFALWKSSKRGEPAWPSPWGLGRPGWHIECSVMASNILGDSMEIHSGGVDLRFPHHDNELAQSEAYFGHSHWVHYFLHSGHLTISGCKMSKSLKNFITIRDALKCHSARRLRLTFLLHSWRDTMDYSQDTLAEAISYEKTLVDFLYNATNLHLLANTMPASCRQSSHSSEHPLRSHLAKAQQEVYDALCDSCDIRRALAVVKELVCLTDQYILQLPNYKVDLVHLADHVYLVASFVLRLLRVLGVADLTLASDGTPVPADATVAGGKISSKLRPIQLDSDLKTDPSNLLRRSWLSLDALTVERLVAALQTTLSATQTLASALMTEGDMFTDIVDNVTANVHKEFGLHLFNLPTDCLTLAVKAKSKRTLSELLDNPFGLETEVWPIVFSLLLQLVLLRQSARARLLTTGVADKAQKQRILSACDRMRDKDLVVAGVRLQDRTSAADLVSGIQLPPCLGLVDASILAEEVRDKPKQDNNKQAKKVRSETPAGKTGLQHPSEFFRNQVDKYSAFDDKGIPTHDLNGNELSKSQLKKLKKVYDAQVKRHEAFVKSKSVTDKER